MKTKIQLNNAQRNHLVRIFCDRLRYTKMWDRMGSTQKALAAESIRLYFLPFKDMASLPLVEVDYTKKEDSEGNIIDEKYKIELNLTFPFIKPPIEVSLEAEVTKSSIENLV